MFVVNRLRDMHVLFYYIKYTIKYPTFFFFKLLLRVLKAVAHKWLNERQRLSWTLNVTTPSLVFIHTRLQSARNQIKIWNLNGGDVKVLSCSVVVYNLTIFLLLEILFSLQKVKLCSATLYLGYKKVKLISELIILLNKMCLYYKFRSQILLQ